MPEIQYKRLTRARGRARFSIATRSRTSLWMGPDHLLSVESDNFRENYKRFYFRDIQAIVVQKTKHFRTWNIILGILSALAIVSALALFRNGAVGGVAGIGILALSFIVVLLLHLVHGPTCRTYLRTAVQIEEFPSLCHIKTTRRVLGQIRPIIVAAQGGELSPETVAAQMRESTAPTATAVPPNNVEDNPNVPPRLSS